MPPSIDQARFGALYLATTLEIEVGGHMVPLSAAVAAIGQPLHIVTAWNPGDERPGTATNREANARLLADLSRHATDVRPAIGRDPDSPHFEESWAASGLDRAAALALGRKYRQVAIFEIQAGRITVLACDGTWELSRTIAESAS